jgi:DNA-binding NarL/FixJ family response regulator
MVLGKQQLSISIKYGLVIAVLCYLFSALKNNLYITYQSWDTYAVVVAIFFLAVGVWISKTYSQTEKAKQILPQALLSKREAEVLELLCQQKTNSQIADELCIELSTLKTHINRIYKKLEVKNRRQLIELICANT